jgi:hypothetical protein
VVRWGEAGPGFCQQISVPTYHYAYLLPMKKTRTAFLFFSILTACGVLFFASGVDAQFLNEAAKQLGATAGEQGADLGRATDPRLIASLMIRSLLGLLGVGFLAYLVYAGYLWMTAAGNTEQIDKAKSTIRRITVGLVIMLAAYSITLFVTGLISLSDDPLIRSDDPEEEAFDSILREQEKYLNQDRFNEDINERRRIEL